MIVFVIEMIGFDGCMHVKRTDEVMVLYTVRRKCGNFVLNPSAVADEF